MYSHACTGCLYYHKANTCSHRLEFEKQGGQSWDPTITDAMVARGGLRHVLAQETASSTSPVHTTPTPLPQKRKLIAELTEVHAQTYTTPKKPRLSTPRPQAKSAFDGESLPWPVPPSAWNDLDKLHSITKDLKSFLAITETRVANLEAESARISAEEYWEREAAKFFFANDTK
ncbi:hypothetical protein BDV12DRAFT_196220 [Aspergillus spectabilis]